MTRRDTRASWTSWVAGGGLPCGLSTGRRGANDAAGRGGAACGRGDRPRAHPDRAGPPDPGPSCGGRQPGMEETVARVAGRGLSTLRRCRLLSTTPTGPIDAVELAVCRRHRPHTGERVRTCPWPMNHVPHSIVTEQQEPDRGRVGRGSVASAGSSTWVTRQVRQRARRGRRASTVWPWSRTVQVRA
jgi:hypothetical protein